MYRQYQKELYRASLEQSLKKVKTQTDSLTRKKKLVDQITEKVREFENINTDFKLRKSEQN